MGLSPPPHPVHGSHSMEAGSLSGLLMAGLTGSRIWPSTLHERQHENLKVADYLGIMLSEFLHGQTAEE